MQLCTYTVSSNETLLDGFDVTPNTFTLTNKRQNSFTSQDQKQKTFVRLNSSMER
jgi:hypothetical protein